MTIGLGPNGTGVLRLVRPGVYLFWCPGCKTGHTFDVHAVSRDGHVVGFDGDVTLPTIGEPVEHDTPNGRCAYRLRAGVLTFESDCWHPLANQSRSLEEFPR